MLKLKTPLSSVFIFFSSLLLAQSLTPEQEKLYTKVGTNLRCPTCTGLGILESDTGFSLQMRQALKEQVLQGKSEDEILTFFTDRYGLWILRTPPAKGVHLLAWLLPVFVFGLGIFWLKGLFAKKN